MVNYISNVKTSYNLSSGGPFSTRIARMPDFSELIYIAMSLSGRIVKYSFPQPITWLFMYIATSICYSQKNLTFNSHYNSGRDLLYKGLSQAYLEKMLHNNNMVVLHSRLGRH